MRKTSLRNQYEIQNGSLVKAITKIAYPIAIANFVTALYNFADSYFVGQVSSTHLAAVAFSFTLIFLFYGFGTGLRLGITSMISKAVGGKEFSKANEIFTVAIIIALIGSLAAVLIGYIVAPSILSIISNGTNDESFTRYAIQYTKIVLFGLPALYLFFIYQGQKQASGDTITPVIIQSLSVALNVLLDYILIVKFNYGVQGAAIATVASQYIMLTVAIPQILSKKQLIYFSITKTKFKEFNYKELIKISGPAMLNDFIIGLSFLVLNMNAATFGTQYIAAAAVGNRYNQLVQVPIFSVSNAMTSIVGQLFGAKKFDRIRKAHLTGMKITASLGFILVIFIYIFRKSLVLLLLNTSDLAAEQFAYRFTVLICVSAVFFGILQINIAVINGLGHTFVSLIINFTRMWFVRIPLFFLLVPLVQQESLWLAMILSVIIAFSFSFPVARRLITKEELKNNSEFEVIETRNRVA